MFDQLQGKIHRTARSLTLGLAGGVMVAVGAGLLSAAAWIVLAASHGHLTAALVLGGAYLGLGLILLGLSRASPTHDGRGAHRGLADTAREDPYGGMAAAFMQGFEAGTGARRPN